MALIRPSSYWRQVSPRGAVADFITVFQQAGKNRWRIAAASGIVTASLFSVMWNEGAQGPPAKPKIDYIRVWDPHRTDAEIAASNLANQKRNERLAAEQAEREENVRQMYKTLGRATGMDVDAIERKAKAEQAAEATRAAASAAAVTPPR